MELWLSWLLGFVVWFLALVLVGVITFLVVSGRTDKFRGHFPDEAFDYRYRSDILPEGGFFLDTHSHTVASDGWMTPEQNIKWHIANGFHAMVVTDHNTTKNNAPTLALQEKYPEIVLVPGIEWTSARIHLNFIGIEEWPHKIPLYNPSDEEVREAIAEAKAMGAVIQCDHISWTVDQPPHRRGDLVHPTREQLVEWGVDGFEINNEMRWYDPKTLHWLDRYLAERPDHRPIFLSTGTDVHNPLKEWATGWTELLLTPEERASPSVEVVKRALLEGRTRIWVDHDYRKPPESEFLHVEEVGRKQEILAPFFGLANAFEKVPGTLGGIVSNVLWLLLLYFPLRLLFAWVAAW
ncbi:MAG: CehA/McbA family metallohydrolase [Promethearchaeota archaeon]